MARVYIYENGDPEGPQEKGKPRVALWDITGHDVVYVPWDTTKVDECGDVVTVGRDYPDNQGNILFHGPRDECAQLIHIIQFHIRTTNNRPAVIHLGSAIRSAQRHVAKGVDG